MGKRYEWIAFALASLIGAPALAQQSYGKDSPAPQGQAAEKPSPQRDGVRLSELDAQQVKALQEALQDAGYYTAEIDGVVGPKTKRALQKFYSDQAQLAAQGMILPRGAEALGLEKAEIERVRGEEPAQVEDVEPIPGPDDEPIDMTRPPEPSSPTPAPGAPQPSSPTPAPGAPNPGPPTSPHSHGTTPY